MSLGLIVNSGRVLTARLLRGDAIDGITHCAIGDGDDTFGDSIKPPLPDVNQTLLKRERARKRFYKRSFLVESPKGPLVVGGIHYAETVAETRTIALFFRFDEDEANGITIKEYGFFGGNVSYIPSQTGSYAAQGVFHPISNPLGEVQTPGYLYEIKNIPDFNKISDTRVEIIGVIKI